MNLKQKNIKLLLYSNNSLRTLVEEGGRVLCVGSVRQIRRRLKVIFGTASAATLLDNLQQKGWYLGGEPQPVLKINGKVYNECMEDLKKKLQQLPKEPGVYRFLDKDGTVLYVGKAKNLKNRVGQYFTTHDDRPQLPYLMQEAADIQYTVVTNELESLFLENTLIKQYIPKYNIMLRDDKNYAFITIDYSCQIPQIGYARKFSSGNGSLSSHSESKALHDRTTGGNSKPKIKYFGPYSAAWKIRNTLHLVRRIFPYCANKEVGSRPCFYYYLHRCPGVCIGKIGLDEYKLQLDRICTFLSGNSNKIKHEIRNDMNIAAGKQQFEKAGRLRDQLQALELLDERQNVIMPKPVSWDIVSLAESDGYACINLFKIRAGKMQDKENFVFESTAARRSLAKAKELYTSEERVNLWNDMARNDAATETVQNFLEQYYLEASNVPKVIYVQDAEDPELISHILRSRFQRKTEIIIPQKGKALELIQLGVTNAAEYLKNWLSNQAGHLDKINSSLEELKIQLHLEKIPERIECYDISNIQGTNPVGSMVVFEKGLPKKSEYRKFKIQSKKTPDDFAMMKEMLTRRLARSVIAASAADRSSAEALEKTDEAVFSTGSGKLPHPSTPTEVTADNSDALGARTDKPSWPMPDLIVIDGGKGQLGVAVEALQKKGLQVPVVGLAKRIEEIFLPGNPEPLVLPHDNPGLQLLQRLRDETHRFGITFHRSLRSKEAVRSALDNIPGIGPKTKKILKEKFGTVANIRKASFDELQQVVGEHLAQLIQQSL